MIAGSSLLAVGFLCRWDVCGVFVGCLLDVCGIFVGCLWVFDDTH